MVFDKKRTQLFNEAYGEYQKILQYINDYYFDENGEQKCLIDPSATFIESVVFAELYMQGCLLKIAVSDGIISDFEKQFIVSMVNDIQTLNQFDVYKRLMRNLTIEEYNKSDLSIFAPADFVPSYIVLAAENDEKYGTNDSFVLMRSTERIFECFMAVDDVCSDEEIKVSASLIETIRQCIEEKELVDTFQPKENSVNVNTSRCRDSLQNLLDELDDLIGLSEVKSEVLATINLIKVNNLRVEKGLHPAPISHHMVFLGNPGTGKTTVARLIAKIYKELGVVTKGHLVETDRSGLVAGYIGQTSIKTKEVATKAIGGILFIDEAYSITRNSSDNDYGKEAIDTLVKVMEDNRQNLVVIVAGYTNEMKNFMKANPGLESRFNKRIFFKDYSQDELLQIFMHTCEKNGFILSREAVSKAAYLLSECAVSKTFGNARGVRNVFDKAIVNQANRIVNMAVTGKRELLTIEKEDIPEVSEMY